MGTWSEITSGRWSIAAFVGAVVLLIAAYAFVVGPTIDQIFADVADDHCPRYANGEPDRSDSDCHSGGLGGPSYVEEWDRLHSSP